MRLCAAPACPCACALRPHAHAPVHAHASVHARRPSRATRAAWSCALTRATRARTCCWPSTTDTRVCVCVCARALLPASVLSSAGAASLRHLVAVFFQLEGMALQACCLDSSFAAVADSQHLRWCLLGGALLLFYFCPCAVACCFVSCIMCQVSCPMCPPSCFLCPAASERCTKCTPNSCLQASHTASDASERTGRNPPVIMEPC